MTAPVWMASPPEVHSALLSSGPGPGPLLAAASSWRALSAEYLAVADELTVLLGGVRAGTWNGPAAEAYAAANGPYLAWLAQAGADSAAAASQQETAATAYSTALAAMPTLGELAANHATHAALVATNFFGINTIPIALNEADYLRMWIQAAAVMSTYQAISGAAVAAAPQSAPAPEIVRTNALAAASSESPPPDRTDDILDWLQRIGYNDFYDNVLQPMINVLMENPYLQSLLSGFDPYLPWTGNPLSFFSPFNIAFALGYPMDISQFVVYLSQTFAFISADLTAAFASGNPVTIGVTLIFTGIEAVGTVITDVIALLKSLLEPTLALIPAALPLLAAPLAPLTAAPLAGLAGLSGLGALYGIPAVPPPPAIFPAPAALAVSPLPVSPPAPAPAAVSAPPPVPAAPAPPPAPPAPPPAFGGPEALLGYLVGGMDLGAKRDARAAAKNKVPMPDPAGASAPVTAVEEKAQMRRRRRPKTTMPGRGHEYMDLEPEHDVPSEDARAASGRGTGPLGFTGTARTEASEGPTGLTTLADDMLGKQSATPMLPGSWIDQPGGND